MTPVEPAPTAPKPARRPPAAQPRTDFPLTVKSGGTVVRIYRTPTTVRGKTYESYTVAWTAGGSRQRKVFTDLDEARKEARSVADQKERGELGVAVMSAGDRLRLADALRELSALPGAADPPLVRLASVVRDYAAAMKLLPAGACLEDAARYFAQRHPASLPRKTLTDVVAEMIEDRRSAGCSRAHLSDLQDRLGRFAAAFRMPVGEITAPAVREYLRTLRGVKGGDLTNRSRRNAQRAITSLFHFCRKQRYIPREAVDEISEIEPPKVEPLEIGVFTAPQIRAILEAAPDDIRAALAVGAFAGLRTAELQRLDWSSVRLAEGVIILGADLTKTASRRVVPIVENLAAWLTPLVKTSGPVSPAPNERAMNHRLSRIAAKVGVRWVRNGLRHGYCSYRLAVTHDAARVALEAGNSPTMIFKHYRSLVTEAQGAEWFAIFPPPSNGAAILPFRNPATQESTATTTA